jgi:cytochrome c oxidase assembly protein subunit 15
MSGAALFQLALVGLAIAALPLGWVWVRARGVARGAGGPARAGGSRAARLAWVTVFITFDLILFGAFTRLTDSGLGCPDWPGCYGHSNPIAAAAQIGAAEAALPSGPVTFTKAWIEMIHRYLAMAVGVLITALMAMAWVARRERSPWPATALFALVCVQGAFGAWTVTLKLMPAIVTLHLLLGVLLLCALGIYAEILRDRPHSLAGAGSAMAALAGTATGTSTLAGVGPGAAAGLRAPASVALVAVFMQIALGGWVSTNYAVLACQDFPLCNGAWLPEADFARGFDVTRPLGMNGDGTFLPVGALVAIHWVHRVFALVVSAALGWLAFAIFKGPEARPLRGFAHVLLGLLALQIASGVSNVVFAWPLAVAIVHNGGAAALALTLTLLLARLAAPAALATGPTPAPAYLAPSAAPPPAHARLGH